MSAIRGPLHWQRLGRTGPAMVLIHPNPTDTAVWLYQTARFSTWFQTVAVDLPGYGRSPAADADLTLEEIAGACWAAHDAALGGGPAILIGLSIGSTIAQYMAALEPARTRALVMTGGGYYPTRDFARRITQLAEQGLAGRRVYVLELFGPRFRTT